MDVETLVGKAKINDNNLLYYLTKTKCEIEPNLLKDTYGVKITNMLDNTVVEEYKINDVNPNKNLMIEFIETLIDNVVTPITLLDIVEDYI